MHYYRAMVGRADIWRTRLDATTNWAIGATAAVVTFVLGTPSIPHYTLFIAPFMTLGFLLLEARRLRFYNLWQGRVLLLERVLVLPALSRAPVSDSAEDEAAVDALVDGLGRTVPAMPLSKAVARRTRRVYGHLFAAQAFAWGLKLQIHPEPAGSLGSWLARAHVGDVGAPVVLGIVGAAGLLVLVLAVTRGGIDTDPG